MTIHYDRIQFESDTPYEVSCMTRRFAEEAFELLATNFGEHFDTPTPGSVQFMYSLDADAKQMSVHLSTLSPKLDQVIEPDQALDHKWRLKVELHTGRLCYTTYIPQPWCQTAKPYIAAVAALVPQLLGQYNN